MEELVNSDQAFGVSDLVMSGYVRVATHPKVFAVPTPLSDAILHVEKIRGRPNHLAVNPGKRHWEIFIHLIREVKARGNHVPDAYHAALAIEAGVDWVTADLGFRRFPGLRVHHPLS